MNLLLIGGGGREHALAWKLVQSPRVQQVIVAPGNAGIAREPGVSCVPMDVTDIDALIALARANGVSLTVVGPEAPLAEGLVDRFLDAGLPCFGPRRTAAQLEASKAFAKAFMTRHNIPTARFGTFTELAPAHAFIEASDCDLVVKASGLAAGKGVVVTSSKSEAHEALERIMTERTFGLAGACVVLEERLSGPEASLFALCDGEHFLLLPAVQDHKRLLEGDRGPNTGGMGAFAPTPAIDDALAAQLAESIVAPTLAGIKMEGATFVGVLFVGLILTDAGPRVLEYNVRFGDPETQALLPLLESDLVGLIEACLEGRLVPEMLRLRSGSAATVVAASAGYPGSYKKGEPITGTEAVSALKHTKLFWAGVREGEAGLETAGGRVLSVTGWGADLEEALERAYAGMDEVSFEGMQVRPDIGKSGA